MIPIHKEPKEMYDWTKVYERCVFCKEQTDMWHKPTNKPVCKSCAKEKEVIEIPEKYPQQSK